MADEHIAYPNLTDFDVEDLTRNSDITAEQVKTWMTNALVKSQYTLQATGAIHLTRRYKMQWDEENKQNPETANKHKKL